MSSVSVSKLALKDYKATVGEEKIEETRALAEKLAGQSVVHVSSTAFGGGVAEILHRLVPLMNNVGLNAEWQVIKGSSDFFNVTKAFHNALQGKETRLTEEMKQVYLQNNEMNAELLKLDHDYVVIHDPQPLAVIKSYRKRTGKWIWRCHIDLSKPDEKFLDFLAPFIELYDAAVFTMKQYAKETLRTRKIVVIPPSIDPLSAKNKPLHESQILSTLEKYDVDPNRPIMTQVARFDPWKDPLGVIDVYWLV